MGLPDLAHVISELDNLGHMLLRRVERRVPRNRSPRVAMIGFPIGALLSKELRPPRRGINRALVRRFRSVVSRSGQCATEMRE